MEHKLDADRITLLYRFSIDVFLGKMSFVADALFLNLFLLVCEFSA